MSSITYIVDDSDPDIKYLCSTTHAHVENDTQANFYEGTWSTIAEGTDCSNGWFQYRFNGTSADVPVTYSQPTTNYSLTVDGSVEVVSTNSPNLFDGEHTLVYATAANASLTPTFDFLTVVAGTTTRMKGRNVTLDDSDSAIAYTGNGWRSTIFPNGRFFKDTVHFTGQVGDSLSFDFPGSSVVIHALLPFSQTGSMTLRECLKFLGSEGDDWCVTWDVSNNDTSSVGVGMVGDRLGGFIKEGVHKMTLSITNVTDDYTIGFDFATYEAIFDSIDAIPTANSRKSDKHVGAIVGGVIGGVAFVALVILALVWWRRWRFASTKKSSLAEVGGGPDSNAEKEGSAPRS